MYYLYIWMQKSVRIFQNCEIRLYITFTALNIWTTSKLHFVRYFDIFYWRDLQQMFDMKDKESFCQTTLILLPNLCQSYNKFGKKTDKQAKWKRGVVSRKSCQNKNLHLKSSFNSVLQKLVLFWNYRLKGGYQVS